MMNDMTKDMMAQCTLVIKTSEGGRKTTVWLDDSKIKKGSVVRLKDEKDFWTVESISDKRLPKAYVNERSQDYKRTRQASDI